MRHLLLPLLLAAASTSLVAQGAPPAIPGIADPSRVVAGTYKMDAAHSQILWRVSHLGFSDFHGFFADPEGTLTIDPRRPAASRVSITIPIERVTSTSAALDKHLRAPDFFNAARFPTATFVSTRIVPNGQRARITGNLTMRGVTRPVVLDARFVGAGNSPRGEPTLNIGFAATTRIKRSDFGITYATPAISDTVELNINAAFVRA